MIRIDPVYQIRACRTLNLGRLAATLREENMNTKLSIVALATSLTENRPSVSFPEGQLSEQIDAIVEYLTSTIESVGGSLDFNLREKASKAQKGSQGGIPASEMFETYPDIRKITMDTFNEVAAEMGVSISDLGIKKKDIYQRLCDARINQGLPVPMPKAAGKSQMIGAKVDIRRVDEKALRQILVTAGLDASEFGRRKMDMILAIAETRNITPARVLEATALQAERNAAKAGAAKVAKMESPAVEAPVVETASIDAIPAAEEMVIETAPAAETSPAGSEVFADVSMASTDEMDRDVEVEVETDNPFLKPAATLNVESEVSPSPNDLDALLNS